MKTLDKIKKLFNFSPVPPTITTRIVLHQLEDLALITGYKIKDIVLPKKVWDLTQRDKSYVIKSFKTKSGDLIPLDWGPSNVFKIKLKKIK